MQRPVLALALLLLGCKAEAPATASAPDAAPVRKVIVPVRKPPPDAPVARPDALVPAPAQPSSQRTELAPSNGPVGVAPCDEYLAKMSRCIKHLGPEAADPMRKAMADSTRAWQANAKTPEGRAALVETCKQALDAAKGAAAAMGCEW